ncbi:MAG: DUF1934 domain-containing protein [Clostridia bacterium]|nr:DUF1934 domain-containing protein [Clostridia bacterium]
MCYNEIDGQTRFPCNVKIVSNGDSLNEDISTGGIYRKIDGGILVCYVSDGDQSTFFFKEGEAEYVRTGSQYIRMFFEQGKTTRCEIGYGNMNGFFEVSTKRIEISSDGRGYGVLLEYQSGQDGESTVLNFTVLNN